MDTRLKSSGAVRLMAPLPQGAPDLMPLASDQPKDERAAAQGGVSCFNCEACCCRLRVILDGDDLKRGLPWHLVEEDAFGAATMRQDEEGWCAAVDRNTMRCTIHPRRPQVCRDFEEGGADCREERGLHSIPTPG